MEKEKCERCNHKIDPWEIHVDSIKKVVYCEYCKEYKKFFKKDYARPKRTRRRNS